MTRDYDNRSRMPSSHPWCYTLSPLSLLLPSRLTAGLIPSLSLASLPHSRHTYPSFPPYDTASSLFLSLSLPVSPLRKLTRVSGPNFLSPLPENSHTSFRCSHVVYYYILLYSIIFHSYVPVPCACTSWLAHFRSWRMIITSFLPLPRGSCNCSLCKVLFIRYGFLRMAFVSMCVIA